MFFSTWFLHRILGERFKPGIFIPTKTSKCYELVSVRPKAGLWWIYVNPFVPKYFPVNISTYETNSMPFLRQWNDNIGHKSCQTGHKSDIWQVIMTENFNIILITDPLNIIANNILYSLSISVLKNKKSISVLPLMGSWDRGHIQYLVTWLTAHLLNVLHAVKTICSFTYI